MLWYNSLSANKQKVVDYAIQLCQNYYIEVSDALTKSIREFGGIYLNCDEYQELVENIEKHLQ